MKILLIEEKLSKMITIGNTNNASDKYVHAPTQCYGLKHIDVFFSTTAKQDVNEIKLLYSSETEENPYTQVEMLTGQRGLISPCS